MKSKTSSSSAESGLEDYSWAKPNNLSVEAKKDYLKYPLKEWKEILYDEDFKKSYLTDEGIYYQVTVAKILEQDLFKDYKFYKEKDGKIEFEFNKVYEKPYQSINKKFIAPDFFVYKIPTKKFFELLKSRNYMLIYNYKIPYNQEFISILGEIKTSRKRAHKNIDQRIDYIKFVEEVNNLKRNEFMVLLYIYDQSFCLFKDEIKYITEVSEDHLPIIYGYIPKLYYENCYEVYNNLITELKCTTAFIDIKDKSKFKIRKNRKQLVDEIKSLQNKNKLLEGFIVFIIAIFIVIIGIFIGYYLK